MLPLKNYQNLPISLRPGLDEPLVNINYAPQVEVIKEWEMSDWLKSAQEEWRKFPPRVPSQDIDALVAKTWDVYRQNQTKPLTKSKKDEFRWWLRGKLVKLGII